MKRIRDAIRWGICHRRTLSQYLDTGSDHRINHLSELTSTFLEKHHIQVLVLDFDGVLSSHGAKIPDSEGEACLAQLCKTLKPIYILSNNPLSSRQQYFATHYPQITWVVSKRKKPYPDGLLAIQELSKTPINSIALVDDRLLTGMLAAATAGAQGLYFSHPKSCFTCRPLTELFFSTLRVLERFIFLLLKRDNTNLEFK